MQPIQLLDQPRLAVEIYIAPDRAPVQRFDPAFRHRINQTLPHRYGRLRVGRPFVRYSYTGEFVGVGMESVAENPPPSETDMAVQCGHNQAQRVQIGDGKQMFAARRYRGVRYDADELVGHLRESDRYPRIGSVTANGVALLDDSADHIGYFPGGNARPLAGNAPVQIRAQIGDYRRLPAGQEI